MVVGNNDGDDVVGASLGLDVGAPGGVAEAQTPWAAGAVCATIVFPKDSPPPLGEPAQFFESKRIAQKE